MPLSAGAASGTPDSPAGSTALEAISVDSTPRPLRIPRGGLGFKPSSEALLFGRAAAGLLTALGFSLLLAACGGKDKEGNSMGGEALSPGAQPLAEDVQALVNQGNEAHRGGRYADALGFYRQAMEGAPGHPVPQFGALMAALALGDSVLADSLRAQLRGTAPELLDMLHPDGSMGPRTSLPPGHPPVEKPGGGLP